MAEQISRRSFIKGGLATAAGLAACSIPGAAAAAEPDEGKQLATLLDIRKCIGCEACVEACSEVNLEKYPDPQKPFPKMYPNRVPVEDWSEKKDVNDRLTPYNWLFIQHTEVEINGYIYGENENGGTNTLYVSPVPFEELNNAIEKGKGKPHLKPVEDTMARANNLAAAMIVAPIAGIAAAVGKFYKRTKQ